MNANRGIVAFQRVLQLVARLEAQSFTDLPWNGRLSLARYGGMRQVNPPYIFAFPYMTIVPYFSSAPQGYTAHFAPFRSRAKVRRNNRNRYQDRIAPNASKLPTQVLPRGASRGFDILTSLRPFLSFVMFIG
jgi:hypothetical protein